MKKLMTALFGKTGVRTTPARRTHLGVEQLGDRVMPTFAALMPAVGALGPAVDVSGLTRGGQNLPYTSASAPDGGTRDVATAGNGNYAVVWKDLGQNGAGAGIYTRLYNSGGTPLTAPTFLAGSNGSSTQPTVAMSPQGGNFVVAWTQPYALNPGDLDVLAQRFGASGSAVGGTITVAYTGAVESQPSLALNLFGDEFAVAFTRVGSVSNVVLEGYNFASGSQMGAFNVTNDSTHAAFQPSVAWNPDNRFLGVAYTYAYSSTDQDVRLQRMNTGLFYTMPLFSPVGDPLRVAQTGLNEFEPSLAIDSDGQAVVAYSRRGAVQGVYATRVNLADSTTSSTTFSPIQVVDPLYNGTHAEAHPSVALLYDDANPFHSQFVLTYALNYQAPTSSVVDWDIHGQILNYYTGQLGSDFLVAGSGNQETSASVAADEHGGFEVIYVKDRDWSKTDNVIHNGTQVYDDYEGVFVNRFNWY